MTVPPPPTLLPKLITSSDCTPPSPGAIKPSQPAYNASSLPELNEPADVVVENPDAEVARINAEEQAKKDAEAAGNAPPAAP